VERIETMFPALFVSHGAPTLPFDDVPARDFLLDLGQSLPRPKVILAVSAHWTTDMPAVYVRKENTTLHDFGGFPRALYDLRYDAPGAPEAAQHVSALLQQAGVSTTTNSGRGLDHGAWVPLLLMYPAADIPVLQLSIQLRQGADHHIALGHALRPFREEGLILASGGLVHNLMALDWNQGLPQAWSGEFAEWMDLALRDHRNDDLVHYRTRAPHAVRAHPSEDHLLPLFVAYGAGDTTRRLHDSTTFGTLNMGAYAFD
jgi:4,5-DOPA dioxygenase extradiol